MNGRNVRVVREDSRAWARNTEEMDERKKDRNEEGRSATSKGDESDTYAMYTLVAMDSYIPTYIHRTIHREAGDNQQLLPIYIRIAAAIKFYGRASRTRRLFRTR